MSEIVYLAQGNGGPAAPSALAAKSLAPGKVELTWTASPTPAPAGTATVYVVKRSKTAGSGHIPVASGLPILAYTDPQAEAGATYSYVVTAVNTGGESVASNELTVTVPAK
jgi:fibronectin type 3 domain-containing protein